MTEPDDEPLFGVDGIGPNPIAVLLQHTPWAEVVRRAKAALAMPAAVAFEERDGLAWLALRFENGMVLNVPLRACLWVCDPVN